eukprot:scaffold5.g892.t1
MPAIGFYRNYGKTFKKPRRPFEKERLDAELKVVGEFGLRNKRELWRVQLVLSKLRARARDLLTLDEKDPKRLFEGEALLRKMYRYGFLDESQNKLDYVLALTPQDVLERRLQTLVFKLGLAKSIHHARVLIRQRHIRVGKQIVNIPSFTVRVDSQKHIDFALNSPFGGGRPGRVKRRSLAAKKGGDDGGDDEDFTVHSVALVALPLATFFAVVRGMLDCCLGLVLGQEALERARLPLAGGLAVLQEVERLVALDVECTTLVCGGRRVQLPVEVCVLDARGATLCHSFCNPCMAEHDGWRHVAGLAPALWLDALPLDALREDLRRLLAGKVVVGHNLGKDLQVLGLADTVPPEALRDTMRYAQLQQAPGRRRRGRRPRRQGRKLSELASEKLGRAIQLERRHDPREDAAAALDLYLSHVHFAAESMDYEDLVEHFAAQILGGGVDGDADGNSRGDSSSGGEEEGSSWAQEWGSMEE